ncbi:hypothetical protein [Streptomyces sp. NPDC048172]|uniref:hypothetical protein n=1 Tax=Streptomyces sp. NPDC048172 TaxID=3365505 RepID=UPI003716E925
MTSARVAMWPLIAVFVAASAFGLFSTEDLDDLDVGWGDRMRVVLALLLQGVGGGFTVSADGDDPIGGQSVAGEGSLSFVPYLSTALWVAALVIAGRWARRREQAAGRYGGGLESALRVGLLCGAGAFALGLYARPSYEGFELGSAPGLTLLWAFLLSTVVAAVVMARGETDNWLAARPAPGPRMAVGALRTALLALVLVLALASVVAGIVVVAEADSGDMDGQSWFSLLVLLPNLGAMALALAWGAPLEGKWNVPEFDIGRETFGYGELADAAGGWALTGTIVGGLACALILGALAARRHADRREQLLAGAFFVVAVLLLVGLGGLRMEANFHEGSGGSPGLGDGYGSTGDSASMSAEGGASGAEMLLFALLWSFGGVLLVPWLLTLAGKGATTAPASPVAPVSPVTPAAPAAPVTPMASAAPAAPAAPAAASPFDTPTYELGQGGAPGGEPPSRGPALKWAALILAAFLVGGAITGGVLLFSDGGDGGKNGKDGGNTARNAEERKAGAGKSGEGEGPDASADPDPDPSASSDSPSDSPSGSATDSDLPQGFAMVDDPEGFRVGVMEGWQREVSGTQIDYVQPTGGDYLRVGVIENAGYTSYDNFLSMEEKAKKRDDYERIEMRRNTFHGKAGARWEFTYTSDESGRTIHAIDQAYVADDGTEYSIYAERRVFEGEENKKDIVFETALDTWQEPAS